MRYAPNPKHKEPWQRGRKGRLCPKEIDLATAQQLLNKSCQWDSKNRYTTTDGKAYRAVPSGKGKDVWHGFPVGWREVPVAVRREWEKAGLIDRRDIKKHWEGE